ncbi:hypothetical protein GRF29_69g1444187 [Pseudopithomyces chartarum]|uniref:Uncharacterized protein n=1 Tax=Pseudopithomyces chartarum TaxID=1892770 RepID=A0AAN6LXK2_9PLEO|nr:hypothetical protein GRF29_69g1444187 [Pseudopithomyces chartarum]
MRASTLLTGSALLVLAAAQTPPANFDLEFHLVQCSNQANPSKDPNTVNNATRTWSHVALYSPNTPNSGNTPCRNLRCRTSAGKAATQLPTSGPMHPIRGDSSTLRFQLRQRSTRLVWKRGK